MIKKIINLSFSKTYEEELSILNEINCINLTGLEK